MYTKKSKILFYCYWAWEMNHAINSPTHTHTPTYTHTHSSLLWHRQSSPARWQWWMQNMKHINAADSGQCQAFLHCVKLNKQDQAKADGNWPSRDRALTVEEGGHRNLKPFADLRWTQSKNTPLTAQMVTLLYCTVGSSSPSQSWISSRCHVLLYTFSLQYFISNRLSLS